MDIKAAENVYKAYKKELPEYSIEILHGKMTSEEKEAVMRSMHKNETQILISTVVIAVSYTHLRAHETREDRGGRGGGV